MTPRDVELLVTHGCDYAPCPNRAEVVLTHPQTGAYLLLLCRVCAPRYQAMLQRLASLSSPAIARANEAA